MKLTGPALGEKGHGKITCGCCNGTCGYCGAFIRHCRGSGVKRRHDFPNPATPLLDAVSLPADLRRLPQGDLRQLADELRAETDSAAVGQTGGHLGAGLGVVELTVAITMVFDMLD